MQEITSFLSNLVTVSVFIVGTIIIGAYKLLFSRSEFKLDVIADRKSRLIQNEKIDPYKNPLVLLSSPIIRRYELTSFFIVKLNTSKKIKIKFIKGVSFINKLESEVNNYLEIRSNHNGEIILFYKWEQDSYPIQNPNVEGLKFVLKYKRFDIISHYLVYDNGHIYQEYFLKNVKI